ncbi:3'(2'),5'-bisphosphate nucleotidase CysQ [Gemmata sp. JC673]|uniref:3'(2'),5'-bisphosphate nucleotidase n=1 Tax=Gemmata algarum TaxID=2975278 RepID=A0ABU5F8W0_9BACT|nr:inositol monophosphatase family protein [Gemmata algarum]MDY3562828.1 3'(2'),5'-bisphosphate nucleotidase CysQ [Gemmata algarum]
MTDYRTELAAARGAAARASDLLRREYEAFTPIPDAPVSISTHADRASQELILGLLHEQFPGDALCAEESTPRFDSVPKSGRRTWVVDPIDGTRGFAKKVGQFSVMIGLLVDGLPVVGVVAEPVQDRITFAQIGGGCWLQVGTAEPTRCKVSARPFDELVLVQSWAKTGMSPKPVRALTPRTVIETYSGGVKLACVARGEADVYANTYGTFADWDICAGHLLVTEAGGTVTFLNGAPVAYQAPEFKQTNGLLATNGLVHAKAVAALSRES